MEKSLELFSANGTSQNERRQPALDPAYVAIDERSIKDLLVFAENYGKELQYFNEKNVPEGDWSKFIQVSELNELVIWFNNLDADAKVNPPTLEPHLQLFVTFLQLLKVARRQLNDLTHRHLEFYYREALQLSSRKAIPDKVHALIELSDHHHQALLPEGSLLKAGMDSLGNECFYRTDATLIASRAKVASVKSLFVGKTRFGLQQARENPDVLSKLCPNNTSINGRLSERSFMAMLSMALGRPNAGGKLPDYLSASVTKVLDANTLNELDGLLAFVSKSLYMPFSSFRFLMALKKLQTPEQWQPINAFIDAAGKRRLAKFKLDISEAENFEKNLLAAINQTSFDDFFNGLPEVEDIYALYRRRDRQDVQDFVKASLFMSMEDFNRMMDGVEAINLRWRQIYEILRTAGRKKQSIDNTHQLQSPNIRAYAKDKFSELLAATLGKINNYPIINAKQLQTFDDCRHEITVLEAYFCMTAEDFVFIRSINQKEADKKADPWQWQQVYQLLEKARTDMLQTEARMTLKRQRETKGLQSMMQLALGEPNPGDNLPDNTIFAELTIAEHKSYIREQLYLEEANFNHIKVTSNNMNATEDDWNIVYAIVVNAQVRKRGNVLASTHIDIWDNLYAAEDASSVQVHLAQESVSATPRWRTFGEEGNASNSETAMLGFALTSPLLNLSEGSRRIVLTLCFGEAEFDRDQLKLALKGVAPFRFLLSTEKVMLPLTNVTLSLVADQPALRIELNVDVQAPPIAPLQTAGLIQTTWPALHMLLNDIEFEGDDKTKLTRKSYQAFHLLVLEKMQLQVDVSGLTQLTLQNDNNQLDPKKPFEPFGYSPVVGNSFFIAHPELCSKRLNNMSLAIEWLAAPNDFSKHYAGYKNYADPSTPAASPIDNNMAFSAELKLYDNRTTHSIGSVALFNAADPKNIGTQQTHKIKIDSISTHYGAYQNHVLFNSSATRTQPVLEWSRYWQLELSPQDFFHSLYPQAAAGCARKMNGAIPAPVMINPPYTPKIKRLSIDYSASLDIDLLQPDLNSQTERLYHIEPFGYSDLADNTAGTVNIAPNFLPQCDNEGELYIALSDVSAPQSVSLLFQLADGSADPTIESQCLSWDYLDGNLWKNLQQGQLLKDNTNGLKNSGIVELALGPVAPSTRLPANLYWLRVSIKTNSRSVANMVAIHTQAVSATLVADNSGDDSGTQLLAAGTISGLQALQAAIKDVQQPYSSFGGKRVEQPTDFYGRVSERLRHKNRALTIWDYEHMVLEAFPSVFKVKCLPVGTSEDPELSHVIQVIVVPDIKGQRPFYPFEPKLAADVLLRIEQFLAAHSVPFAKICVRNPNYVKLHVRLGVRLFDSSNNGYFKQQLNQELQRFLAPWAYDESADISFGCSINASQIVNHLEQLAYVDYVAGIHLTFTSASGTTEFISPEEILIPDYLHSIDLISEEDYRPELFTGIGYMKIGLDFQIVTH